MPEHGEHTPEERAARDHGAHEQASGSGSVHDRFEDQKTLADGQIDIATGEFLCPGTDVDLPGILPLVLRRTHLSGYCFGRWFGPSWSSTLDVRLVVEDAGVTFLGEDGVMLAYPHARADVPVEPTRGRQRWTLTRVGSGYRVWDPYRERIWHFTAEPESDGIEARLGNYAISAITDRHRNRIRFRYDTTGTPVAVVHSGGYHVIVDSADGRVTGLSVRDRGVAVPVRGFAYTAGILTTIVDAAGAAVKLTYDELRRMVSRTDSRGNRLVNTYDESGRVVSRRSDSGILDTDFEYVEFPDGTGSLTAVTDACGAVTKYGFDRDYRLRDRIDAVGGRTHIEYNVDRRPVTVTTPGGVTTRYRYTGDGDILEHTRPDGATLTADYPFRHRATRMTDADGTVYHQEWTEEGDLAATVDASGARTRYTWHRGGALATVTDPSGIRTTVEVDPAGLPVTLTESSGAITVVHRDGFGRPIELIDPRGGHTLYEWTSAGKPRSRRDPDGNSESRSYDDTGNLVAHTDRAGGVTHYTYGVSGLPATRTDPGGDTTGYLWDRQGRPVAVVDPEGRRWSYVYDALGRTVSETDFTGATTHYTHDHAGRIATVTAATGVTRRCTYDVLGRIIEIAADTGEFRRYTRDRSGRIVTAVAGGEGTTHTVTVTYTPTGQPISEQVDDRPPTRYEYDAHRRLVRRTTPGGSTTTWQFDHNSRITGLETDGHPVGFTCDALGQPTGWWVGEIELIRTTDNSGQVTARTVTAFPATTLNLGSTGRPAPQRLFHDEYTYRADGHLTGHTVHRANPDPVREHRRLDPIGRITEMYRNDALAESYRYDPLGNLTDIYRHITDSEAEPSNPETTQANSTPGEPETGRPEHHGDPLPHAAHTHHRYDPAGRPAEKTVTHEHGEPDIWHYRFDAFDQLIEVRTPDRHRWRHTYDGYGRRVTAQRLDPSGEVLERTDFTWDASYLIEESTGSSNTCWNHEPGTATAITRTVDRRLTAVVTGPDGTPTALLDPESGQVTALAGTDPGRDDGPEPASRAADPDAQTRSRNCSISFTRSAEVAAIGTTFSTVTPAAANAATRSFTNPAGPISETARTSSSGTARVASSFFPARYSSWIRSAAAP